MRWPREIEDDFIVMPRRCSSSRESIYRIFRRLKACQNGLQYIKVLDLTTRNLQRSLSFVESYLPSRTCRDYAVGRDECIGKS